MVGELVERYELIIRLDRDESHVLSIDGLGDRFGFYCSSVPFRVGLQGE